MTDYIDDAPNVLDEEMQVIPVHIASSGVPLFRSVAPEFGSTMTFPVPDSAANAPVQILNRKPKRHRAVILVQAFAAGVTSVIISSRRDALANPAIPVAAGSYLVFTVAPFTYVWESQQPAYAVAPGAGTGTQPVLVLDESYG
jgi:hypothetical protein